MEERRQAVIYESLQTICFYYGRYGHVMKNYLFGKRNNEENGKKGCGIMVTDKNKVLMESGGRNGDIESVNLGEDTFGRWMIAEKKKKKVKSMDKGKVQLNQAKIGGKDQSKSEGPVKPKNEGTDLGDGFFGKEQSFCGVGGDGGGEGRGVFG